MLTSRFPLLALVPADLLAELGLTGDRLTFTVTIPRAGPPTVTPFFETTGRGFRLAADIRPFMKPGESVTIVVTENADPAVVLPDGVTEKDYIAKRVAGESDGYRYVMWYLINLLLRRAPSIDELRALVIETYEKMCETRPQQKPLVSHAVFRPICRCCFEAAAQGATAGNFYRRLSRKPGALGRQFVPGEVAHGINYVRHDDPWYRLFLTLYASAMERVVTALREDGTVERILKKHGYSADSQQPQA